MTMLMKAHNEWARRAADERFGSLNEMFTKSRAVRQTAATKHLPARDLYVRVEGDDNIVLNGKTGTVAKLTHHSFNTLSSRAGAPASYLRELSPKLAVACLNEGFSLQDEKSKASLLFNQDESGLTLRGVTSEGYSRIWNDDILSKLIELQATTNWQPAPAAFDGSRGLYMGDRDMFCFMVDNNRRIFEKGPGGGLSRGFFCWNSEVGARSFGIMTFFYEYVCGNHRVWGASEIKELRIRHTGDANERWMNTVQAKLVEYANGATTEDELKVQKARTYELGHTKEDVIDRIFGMRMLTRKQIEEGYELAVKREDWYGNPRTAWGLVGGLTEIARDLPNADDRSNMERGASRIMEIAF